MSKSAKVGTNYPISLDKMPPKFNGVSLDGFLVWAKREYDLNPDTKVTVKFLLEVLRPELLAPNPPIKGKD